MKLEFPKDAWGEKDGIPATPRRWQKNGLPVILDHYSRLNPSRAVVYAVTGSGKSIFLAQICACIQTEGDEVIVVSTSRQSLVRQIRDTIRERLEGNEFMAEPMVGTYFTGSKDVTQKVIVCCNASLVSLAESLSKIGRRVCLWICDELHRSACKTMLAGADKLMAVRALGLSATPFLANLKKAIPNFDDVIVRYSVADALADGVIVPWEVRNWEGGEVSLDEACLTMMKACGKRGIVNAVTIDDALAFAKYCGENDYVVKVVHSEMPHAEIDKVIQEFRTEQIDAICHVDLLSEGVDICEILHMTLRRVVSSRNRFIQEVGRGIRAYKNKVTGEIKTHLICNDIHDLFGVLRLSGYAEALSGDVDPDDMDIEGEPEGKRLERTLQQECFNIMRHVSEVKAGKTPYSAAPLASYLSQLCSVFDTFGLMDKQITSREWRRAPATGKQITAMENMKWAFGRKQVPSVHRTALEMLSGVGSKMSRGMCSDLISIETSLIDKSTWPKFSQLDKCVSEGLERHAKRKATPAIPKSIFAPTGSKTQGPKLEQGMLFGDLKKK